MRTKEQLSQLREQVVALRLAGKSRREIKELLAPIGNHILDDALRGTPPPGWTRRPNAKDDLREEARALRTQGLSVNEIAARLNVAKSSVSLWVRDLPLPERFNYAANPRRYEGLRRYVQSQREARAAQRMAETEAAAGEIGDLSDREVVIAGAIAYWCEGAKNKPNRRTDRVVFINSDPGLIRFFLRFLYITGVNRDDLVLRVYIHENASVEAAEQFWLEVTGAHPSQLRSAVLKHHNPKTHRTNVGENYHGCLKIEVRRSRVLYQKIEGWTSAIMASPALSAALNQPVS